MKCLWKEEGIITVEAAIWIGILIPVAVLGANVVDAWLTDFIGLLQIQSQQIEEFRTLVCPTLSNPPPACNP